MSRRWLGFALGLLVSAACLYGLFSRVPMRSALASAQKADWGLLALCLVTRAGGFGFMTARSRTMLQPLGSAGFWRLLASHLVGFAGNVALPFRAGEVLRIEYVAHHEGLAPSSLVAVVGLERLLDAFLLLCLLAVTLPLVAMDLPLADSVPFVALAVGLAGAAALAASHRPAWLLGPVGAALRPFGPRIEALVLPRAQRFAEGLAGLSSLASVGLALLWTAGYWGCGLLSVQLWLLAFDVNVAWYAPALVLVFSAFGAAVPAAPGAVGTYHVSVAFALTLLGAPEDVAASIAVVGHALSMVPSALAGLPLLLGDQALRAR